MPVSVIVTLSFFANSTGVAIYSLLAFVGLDLSSWHVEGVPNASFAILVVIHLQ